MRIEHLAVYVDDLEGAKIFFEKYFDGKSNSGYHNERSGFRSYFISFDSGARLELMNEPEVGKVDALPRKKHGYTHVAFSLSSKEKVEEATAKLASDGFEVLSGPRTTGDGYFESCIVGFEDILVEITV